MTSSSQVSGSVSTTFGGVPRVCRGPGIACTAPSGGTRTSTDLPGTRAASSSSVKRTAVRTCVRSAVPVRQAASAAAPVSTSILRATITPTVEGVARMRPPARPVGSERTGRKGWTVSERGFFSRITDPIAERVREGVDSVEEKVKAAIQAQTDKVRAAAQAKAQAYGPSVVSFGVAGVLVWLGTLCLVAAAVIGLSEVLHPALAALVVSAVLFLTAGILGLWGKSNLPKSPEQASKAVRLPEEDHTDHFWTD